MTRLCLFGDGPAVESGSRCRKHGGHPNQQGRNPYTRSYREERKRILTPDAVFVHEDGDINITGKNNDLFDCLPDGADADGFTNGCIRIATLNDLISNAGEGAEWTGGIFDQTGKRFFVSVQHNMTGFGVVLEVTGWK